MNDLRDFVFVIKYKCPNFSRVIRNEAKLN